MTFFWDTNLFVYLWEEGPYARMAGEFASWISKSNHQVVTSTLTLGEILVHPFRLGNETRVNEYERAFSKLELLPFTVHVAREFARLRANHPSLRPPDAMQIATAACSGAEYFVTNDSRLSSVPFPSDCKLLMLEAWETVQKL